MGLRLLDKNLHELSIEPKIGLKDYSVIYKQGIRIKRLLKNQDTTSDIKSGRTPSKFNEDYWKGDYDFLTMQDVDTDLFCLKNTCESKITDLAIEELKTLYQVKSNSLVISNAMTIGLAFLTDRNIFLNQNVFHLDLDDKKVNIKYLLWYFNLQLRPIFQKLFTSKYLSKDELGRVKIPDIEKSKQDEIAVQIEPIEQKINDLKAKIKAPQETINRVFAREFDFNLEQFEALKKVKIFDLDISHFGNNKDLRNSVKFHRQAGQFVLEELAKITSKKIKDYIAEPIVLGKGISPAQYDDENGEYYYLSMATIKNWKFEKENARLVTDQFATDNENKTIKNDDILLARSGEGTIGKVAIIDNEELQGMFADFTMRIRLEEYNCLFAYYYFRTEYFQYLVEINKKGLGNNTNIFPSQIQEFPLLDISEEEQKRIVTEIKTELDAQEKIKTKIEKERNKIDEIIVGAIKNS